MTLTTASGKVRFKIKPQEAQPKWIRAALRDNLTKRVAPPEALRYQCRIATDARENFSLVELDNGETMRLSPSAKPQFGKNHEGRIYLTATLIYSGDGESYKVRWIGDAVPTKMIDVAVRHDQGLAAKGATVVLDMSQAEITPSHKAVGPWQKHKSERDYKKEYQVRGPKGSRALGGVSGVVRSKRYCGRATAADTASA